MGVELSAGHALAATPEHFDNEAADFHTDAFRTKIH